MNTTLHEVEFENGAKQLVYAFNFKEAEILAQASQIKRGESYEVVNVRIAEERS